MSEQRIAELTAIIDRLRTALIAQGDGAADPCWCGVSVGAGRDHSAWCIAARAALSASPAETIRQERDIYKALAAVGTWHDDCRPNREMAARELAKSQAIIDKLADRITELERAAETGRASETSTYAICENHAPDRWEGGGTCIVCEAQRLWDELNALKKASETSGWRQDKDQQ